MAAAPESLSRYFPQGGLAELGFRNPKPAGYASEGGTLFAFYTGEVTRMTEEGPLTRRMLVLTDGDRWLVGARDGVVKTSDMLDDLLHTIKKNKADQHIFLGEVLPGILCAPDRLPEIAARPAKPQHMVHLSGVRGHSFE